MSSQTSSLFGASGPARNCHARLSMDHNYFCEDLACKLFTSLCECQYIESSIYAAEKTRQAPSLPCSSRRQIGRGGRSGV